MNIEKKLYTSDILSDIAVHARSKADKQAIDRAGEKLKSYVKEHNWDLEKFGEGAILNTDIAEKFMSFMPQKLYGILEGYILYFPKLKAHNQWKLNHDIRIDLVALRDYLERPLHSSQEEDNEDVFDCLA